MEQCKHRSNLVLLSQDSSKNVNEQSRKKLYFSIANYVNFLVYKDKDEV